MNSTFFPDDSQLTDLFTMDSLETPSIVQFIHRNIAYCILLFYFFIFYKIYRRDELFYLRNTVLFIFISLFIQIFLGIITVLSGAHLLVASLHQIGSILLITATLILVFKNSKIN